MREKTAQQVEIFKVGSIVCVAVVTVVIWVGARAERRRFSEQSIAK